MDDGRAVAHSIAESFRSGLRAFVFDRRVFDERLVENLLSASGVRHVLERFEQGNIIVYFLRDSYAERECLYSVCSKMKDSPKLSECLQRCKDELLRKLGETIAESVLEYAASKGI